MISWGVAARLAGTTLSLLGLTALRAGAVVPPKLTAVDIATALQARGLPITNILNSYVEAPPPGHEPNYVWSEALFRDRRILKSSKNQVPTGPQLPCANQPPTLDTDNRCGGDIYVWKDHSLAVSAGVTGCGYGYRLVAGDVSLGVSWYLSSGLTLTQAQTYVKPLAAIVGQSVHLYHSCPSTKRV